MSASGGPVPAAVAVEVEEARPAPERVAEPPELTLRALGAGCAIGAMIAVTNVYMGLKTSWWESGSIFASVVGFAVVSPLARRGRVPYSVLENNLTQSAASSVGAVPAAAGLLGALPALTMMGLGVPGWGVAAWGLALGLLGVLAAFLLRQRLVVDEALPFPTGAATAELIGTLHGAGTEGKGRAWGFAGTALGSMALTWMREARGWIPQLTVVPGTLAGLPAGTFTLGVAWSPMLLGIGAMTGPHMGLSMLLGGLTAWAVLAPWLVHAGVVTDGQYESFAAWLMWPGVGLMVGASLMSLLSQARTFVGAARDVRALGWGGAGRWVAGVGLVAMACVVALGVGLFGVSPGNMVLVLVLLLPLCAVFARAAGLTDIAPVSQMGQLTQVASGALLGGGLGPNVAAGSVVAGAVANTGVCMWAHKAGHLLGATPRRQLAAQLVGVGVGTAVAVPAYLLLSRAYTLGSALLPVPAARQFRGVAELSVRGLSGLPPHAGAAALAGFALAVVLTLLARGRLARWVPSPVAMGIGFIVPAAYSVTLCLGALVSAVRWGKAGARGHSAATVGAGAIAGESLMGVLVAAVLALTRRG